VLVGGRISTPAVADIAGIYTIGMPRAADADYAKVYGPLLGARTYRLVHGEDLVPTVPPTTRDFCHVGRYLPCQRQGKFSAADLAADWQSDRPNFRAELMEEFRQLRRRPWLIATAAAKRAALAVSLAVGRGPAGLRTDMGGIAIELLPPRFRDHMPDRYIGGLTPGASLF
jgi:triacylglycerol lipase